MLQIFQKGRSLFTRAILWVTLASIRVSTKPVDQYGIHALPYSKPPLVPVWHRSLVLSSRLAVSFFKPSCVVSQLFSSRYALNLTSSSVMVSWPTCGRQKRAKKAPRTLNDAVTKKGYWADATLLAPPAFSISGKTNVPTKAPILPVAAATA